MEVQGQTLQHPPAFLKGHCSERRPAHFPSEGVRARHVNSFCVRMANQLSIDGMQEGGAFSAAHDPSVLDEVSEFVHLPKCFEAKLAVVLLWTHNGEVGRLVTWMLNLRCGNCIRIVTFR